jgi:hypothetical protein
MPAARAFAERIAQGPAVAVQLAKRLVYRGQQQDVLEALESAGQAMAIVQSTEDSREGPRAFAEKRPPRFPGPVGEKTRPFILKGRARAVCCLHPQGDGAVSASSPLPSAG